jgi:hypothetical protein
MVAVMNAQRVVPTATACNGKAVTRVAFSPSSIRGTAIRAMPVRAARKQISTICKAVVSCSTVKILIAQITSLLECSQFLYLFDVSSGLNCFDLLYRRLHW